MAYTDIATLILEMTKKTLIEVTDDYDTKEVDTGVVDWAIEKAEALIDAYNNGRFPTDILDGDVPPFIKSMCTDFAMWYLYKRVLATTMPEPLQDCYNNWIKMLEDMQKGEISPFPESETPQRVVVNTRQRVFTADKLAKFRCPGC